MSPTLEAWHCRYVQFRCALEQALFPRLNASVISAIDEQHAQFLAGPFDFEPVFIHSDLGVAHILVDPRQVICRA